MALSTTFTQHAAEITKFLKNHAKYGPFRRSRSFKVIQGHRFWYQKKAHIRLPIND